MYIKYIKIEKYIPDVDELDFVSLVVVEVGLELDSVDLGLPSDEDESVDFFDDLVFLENWPNPRGVFDVFNKVWNNWDIGGSVCW